MSSRPSRFPLTQPGRLRLYSTAELGKMPTPEWQVNEWIHQGAFVVVYGPPGCGKSFVVGDMGCSVSTGLPWQGQDTEQGHMLYVAGEGGSGMGKRSFSWMHEKSITDPDLLDVSWLLEPFPVQADSEDMHVLLRRIEEMSTRPSFVVIDTLARCYEGDENTQEDMSAFIRGVDQIRQEFGSTVVVIHHTRLDGDRERGNTALRGAADTMISVACKKQGSEKLLTLKVDKQKEAREADPKRLVLAEVPEFDSCVVRPVQVVGRSATALIASLRQANIAPGATLTFTGLLKVTGWNKMSLSRALDVTCESGEIIKENGKYLIVR